MGPSPAAPGSPGSYGERRSTNHRSVPRSPSPLGPDDGTSNEIVDQMLRQAQKYKAIAGDNLIRAIRRNTAHYMGISRTFEPGDLVFTLSEITEDQAPHRKLQLKRLGP